jgi:hypothetical protein
MRRTILAVVAAAATATLGFTGVALASGTSQTEHFSIVGTSVTSNAESIIATGAFTAGGVDHSGNKVDKVQFSTGTFTITHKGTQKVGFNAKTCLATITGAGTYVLSGGTGAYKGLSGSGNYKFSAHEVASRSSSDKCTNKAAAYQQVIAASGPVSLP